MPRSRSRRDPESLWTFNQSLARWNRRRDIATNKPTGEAEYFLYWTSPPTNWAPLPNQIGQQVTVDENHSLHRPSDLRGGSGDVGGPFDMQRWGIRGSAPSVDLRSDWGIDFIGDPYQHQSRYFGPVFARNPTSLTPSSSGNRASEAALAAEGTTAIARCKPTNHISDLANDLTEIYHGQLPNLPGRRSWQRKTRIAKAAGDEYLNAVFGWLPLVSDVHDAMYAAANSDRLMKAYENNSGKTVRRRYEFPIEESVTSFDSGPTEGWMGNPGTGYQSLLQGETGSMPHLMVTTRSFRRVWFSGSFTYHLPAKYKSRDMLSRIAAEAAHLYGVELTPKVLWDVTPWTWAIDWFSNAGDVISNLSSWATDGLVMSHGYVMEHVFRETSYVLDRPTRFKTPSGGLVNASPVSTYYESKRRLKATPFGFGSTWSSLSPRQWAIAVALGITKFLP